MHPTCLVPLLIRPSQVRILPGALPNPWSKRFLGLWRLAHSSACQRDANQSSKIVGLSLSVKGHLRSRGSGTWELIVYAGRDPLSGRQRRKTRTVHDTKRDAQRELAALVTEVSTASNSLSEITVAELLARWLAFVADDLSPTTVDEYRRLCDRRIIPAVGSQPIRKLSVVTLDAFYVALRNEGGLGPASIRQIHATFGERSSRRPSGVGSTATRRCWPRRRGSRAQHQATVDGRRPGDARRLSRGSRGSDLSELDLISGQQGLTHALSRPLLASAVCAGVLGGRDRLGQRAGGDANGPR